MKKYYKDKTGNLIKTKEFIQAEKKFQKELDKVKRLYYYSLDGNRLVETPTEEYRKFKQSIFGKFHDRENNINEGKTK